MSPRPPRHARRNHGSATTRKSLAIGGGLGCCGCGGVAAVLLLAVGTIGAMTAPGPSVSSAAPSAAVTTSPATTAAPTTTPPPTTPAPTTLPPTAPPPTPAPTTPPPTTPAPAPTTEAPVVVAAENDDDAQTKPRGIADTGSGGSSKRQKSEATSAPRKADPAPEPAKEEKKKEEKKEEKKEDSGGGGSYANCDEVRAAGKAPIRRGDPGFKKKFDRDGDGVGCE